MSSVTEFYNDPDWEGSSGPIISRQYDAADLWPHGAGSEIGGGDKDVLEDGLHPFLAIGPKASVTVGSNKVGVVISMETNLVQVNTARGFCAKAYVSNVVSYGPTAYTTTLSIGDPVYLDNSAPMSTGVTLSRSPLDSNGAANPLAGWFWYDQDDYHNNDIGGANAAADWPKTVANSLVETLVTVMLA